MNIYNLIPKKSEKITSPEDAAKLVELADTPEKQISLDERINEENTKKEECPEKIRVVAFPLRDSTREFFIGKKKHGDTYKSLGLDIFTIDQKLLISYIDSSYTTNVKWLFVFLSGEEKFKPFMKNHLSGILNIYDKDRAYYKDLLIDAGNARINVGTYNAEITEFRLHNSVPSGVNDTLFDMAVYDKLSMLFSKEFASAEYMLAYFYSRVLLKPPADFDPQPLEYKVNYSGL